MCDFINVSHLISTVTGVLIGAWLTRSTSFKVVQRQEITRDYTALKNSFLPVLKILKKSKRSGEDFRRIPTYFDTQETAMLSFVGHLSGEARRTFEEKWNKYQEWYENYEELESQSVDLGVLAIPKQIPEITSMIDSILEAGKKF